MCEHTESRRKKLHDHFVGRTMEYYKDQVVRNGFKFKSAEYLNIQASYFTLEAIRELFNPRSRKEGEPFSPLSINLQKMAFRLTRYIDQ